MASRQSATAIIWAIIQEISGTQLNPEVVKVLMDLVEEGAFDTLRRMTEGDLQPKDDGEEQPVSSNGKENGNHQEE